MAAKIRQTDYRIFRSKATIAFDEGNYEAAIKYFCHAIIDEPTDYLLYANRSAAYASTGQYEESLRDAEKCIQLNPKFDKGFARKAIAQLFMEQIDEAIVTYQQGIRIHPDNEMLQRGLKDVLNAKQMQLETKVGSEEKIKLDPQDQALVDSILRGGPQSADPAKKKGERRSFLSRMANPLDLSFKGWLAYTIAVLFFISFVVYQRVVPLIDAYENRAQRANNPQGYNAGGPPRRRKRNEF